MKKSVFLFCFLFFINSLNAQWLRTKGLYGGTVNDIAIRGNNIYAATTHGGMFLSTNSGTGWMAINKGFVEEANNPWPGEVIPSMRALALDDSNIFVGTFGFGMYRSTNNGLDWHAVNNGLYVPYVNTIVIRNKNMFAGTDAGVFISDNNGASWTSVSNGLPSDITMTLVSKDSLLFAGYLGSGVFYTGNNGTSWHPANNGIDMYVNALAATDSHLFVATYEGGIFRSADNGLSWTLVNSDLAGNVSALASYNNNIYAGTSYGILVSKDNGDSWMDINNGPMNSNIDIITFAFRDSSVFAGTAETILSSGGVFLSTNAGNDWKQVNNGLAGVLAEPLEVHNSNLFVGTYSSGPARFVDENQTWAAVGEGFPYCHIQDFAVNDSNLFAGTSDKGIFVSSDNGGHWMQINNGLECEFVYALAFNNDYLFAGTIGIDGGIYRSGNNGASWTQVNSGLSTEGPGPSYPSINAFVVSDTSIYASSDNGTGVYLSTNNGDNWTAVNAGLSLWTENCYTTCLASVGSNIFAGTKPLGVYRFAAKDSSWISVSAGLTNPSIECLYGHDSSLFAGTNGSGIFISKDYGANWFPINQGLEYKIILDLVVKDSVLYATTLGGGVWIRPLSEIVTATGDNNENEIPSAYTLYQNYPNPFNPSTTIKYYLPKGSFVSLKVFNILGQEVTILVTKEQRAGEYSIEFNSNNLASGVYIFTLETSSGFRQSRKMVLIK